MPEARAIDRTVGFLGVVGGKKSLPRCPSSYNLLALARDLFLSLFLYMHAFSSTCACFGNQRNAYLVTSTSYELSALTIASEQYA